MTQILNFKKLSVPLAQPGMTHRTSGRCCLIWSATGRCVGVWVGFACALAPKACLLWDRGREAGSLPLFQTDLLDLTLNLQSTSCRYYMLKDPSSAKVCTGLCWSPKTSGTTHPPSCIHHGSLRRRMQLWLHAYIYNTIRSWRLWLGHLKLFLATVSTYVAWV